jgi:hypothetical protein
MFSWEDDIENLGDNERLVFVLENLPDEGFMRKLEKERGNGRDDFPVRAMWNLTIAMFVFGHGRQTDILRELGRNAQLRILCGFAVFGKLPGEDSMSRFMAKLQSHEEDVLSIFVSLSDRLYELLPDFGETLALDGKWVWSLANKRSAREKADGRSETDADWGVKDSKGRLADGTPWAKKEKCFGFKIHLLVDAKYELPVAFAATSAGASEKVWAKKLLCGLAEERPHVIERCKHLVADKGYDDTDLIEWLQDTRRGIKSVIDNRIMRKSEPEREVPGCPRRYYDEHGAVFCYSPEKGERHCMAAIGYDKERDAQRFKCPAAHYGMSCAESGTCGLAKTIRIPLSADPRIFTQVGRTTYQWKRIYAARTAVERVNSRLDVSFGFEARRVRGIKKMNLFALIAFAVMDALAVGSILSGEKEKMRSLVSARAA